MNLILFEDTIALCKLSDEADPANWNRVGPLHVSIHDPHGQTLLCHERVTSGHEPEIVNLSLWRCFQIDAVMDFNTVGVLAEFSGLLAERAIPLMTICSFETDYLLVQPRHVEAAAKVLQQAGHTIDIQ